MATTGQRFPGGVSGTGGGSGSPGTPGSVWRDGSGVPSNTLGVNGDYYLNDTNGDVYQKTAGAYVVVTNIKGTSGSAGTIAPRGTVNLNTASIADQATETGTVALGKAFAIMSVQVSTPCRVRVYSTVAARDADLGRSATTGLAPNTQHGCILDLLVDVTMGLSFPTTWILSPLTYGADLKATPDGNIPYSVQNLSGIAQSVQVVFTRTLEEQ